MTFLVLAIDELVLSLFITLNLFVKLFVVIGVCAAHIVDENLLHVRISRQNLVRGEVLRSGAVGLRTPHPVELEELALDTAQVVKHF